MNTPHNNTTYFSQLTTTHDSQNLKSNTAYISQRLTTTHNDSQRLTATHSDSQRLTTTHESQGESEIPHDSYDSQRLTTTHESTCFERMYMIITRLQNNELIQLISALHVFCFYLNLLANYTELQHIFR